MEFRELFIEPYLGPFIPPVAYFILEDAETPVNEEAEILAMERQHHAWLNSITNIAADLNPIGKVLTMTGQETDDEDANDDSEDTDEEDDEEIDRLIANRGRMDTSYSPTDGQNPNVGEGSGQN